MKHTPEPWAVTQYMPDSQLSISADGAVIGTIYKIPFDTTHTKNQANAKRIVACVNACAGIDNADLSGGLVLVPLSSLKAFRRSMVGAICDNPVTDYKDSLADAIDLITDYITPQGVPNDAKEN